MSWLYLLFAVALEITWVLALKTAQQTSSKAAYALTAVAYVACLLPLSLASRTIETSIVYAIWVGMGIVGVSVISALRAGTVPTLPQLVCIALVLVGATGLKLLSA